jgi:predicted ester cyclase
MSQTADPAQATDTVRRFVDAINRHDWQALESLLAPTFSRHSIAAGDAQIQSPAALVALLEREYATFPDAHEVLLDAFSDGRMVAARHRFRGTHLGPLGPHAATGRVMQSDYIALYRLEGGRIAEAWAEWDNLAGLKQLGLMPGDRA